METPYTAVKVVYNRKLHAYELEVIRNADMILVHHGYFVYQTDNPISALNGIHSGLFLQHWKEEHRKHIIGFLGLEPDYYTKSNL